MTVLRHLAAAALAAGTAWLSFVLFWASESLGERALVGLGVAASALACGLLVGTRWRVLVAVVVLLLGLAALLLARADLRSGTSLL